MTVPGVSSSVSQRSPDADAAASSSLVASSPRCDAVANRAWAGWRDGSALPEPAPRAGWRQGAPGQRHGCDAANGAPWPPPPCSSRRAGSPGRSARDAVGLRRRHGSARGRIPARRGCRSCSLPGRRGRTNARSVRSAPLPGSRGPDRNLVPARARGPPPGRHGAVPGGGRCARSGLSPPGRSPGSGRATARSRTTSNPCAPRTPPPGRGPGAPR